MLMPSIEISYDLTRPMSDVLRRIFMRAIDWGKSNSIESYTSPCEPCECYNRAATVEGEIKPEKERAREREDEA